MSFWYLATPYSKYPDGIEAAYRAACKQAAILTLARIPVFSPIAHTHGVAVHGRVDPLNHDIWLAVDEPMMRAAHGLIMCKLPSWELSYGMAWELMTFGASGKPIAWVSSGELPELE